MLKIYKHILAQATIKIKVGDTTQFVKFTGGRNRGTDEKIVGGLLKTTDPRIQQALESRSDYQVKYFIDHKIAPEVAPTPQNFQIFAGVDTINEVKNILKKEFGDSGRLKGSDLQSTEDMLKFSNNNGVAFPDFFTKEQGHFKEDPEKFTIDREVAEEDKVDLEPLDFEKKEITPLITTPIDLSKEKDEEKIEEEIKKEIDKIDEILDAEEFEEIEIDPEALMEMHRGPLNKAALEYGVPNPDKLANKAAVIEAIIKISKE